MVKIETHLAKLGIELPRPPNSAANYVPCKRSGDHLYLSGHLPLKADGTLMTGKIGPNHNTVEYGQEAARAVGLNLLATIQSELGTLDNVEHIVKLFGIVQSTDDFHEQHIVMNACSDLMVDVFGKEGGVHARSAIGTNSLPLNLTLEVEAIVKIRNECLF